MEKTKYFIVYGKVQGVMFRQTLIRAAQKRNLEAGATNSDDGKNVEFCLSGDEKMIQEIIDFLKSGQDINSWSPKINEVQELPSGKSISEHEVSTDNVDNFKWSTDIEMFL